MTKVGCQVWITAGSSINLTTSSVNDPYVPLTDLQFYRNREWVQDNSTNGVTAQSVVPTDLYRHRCELGWLRPLSRVARISPLKRTAEV